MGAPLAREICWFHRGRSALSVERVNERHSTAVRADRKGGKGGGKNGDFQKATAGVDLEFCKYG